MQPHDELMLNVCYALNKIRDAEQTLSRILSADESKRIREHCQKLQENFSTQAKHVQIEDLNLSLRYLNALKNFGDIHGTEHLVQKTERDIKKLPNIGAKGIREIKDALATRNLALKII
jgi:DNA-directed RNA polymerase alpha subunit